ncbi:YfiT family bacillithiol transferase [Paenibacillus silvisoli]|uniref:YfiT family bacillithiol transferase n=1 Tax=Paenibacillus silvisoli TaxID=3110539 RepID=UPI0028046AFF|nr:putative metal-dependent hydrolase [Paenibacillus silvisoli]
MGDHIDRLRYPIGKFEAMPQCTNEDRAAFISHIPDLTKLLRACAALLKPGQLDIPYREGGWSVRQIAHHMADNDMNAYLRFKRALTEEEPLASSYREDLFAELPDYGAMPLEDSILLLEVLHRRFFVLVQKLPPEAFSRTLRTLALGTVTLDTALQRFVWHNRHHIAQIEAFALSKK